MLQLFFFITTDSTRSYHLTFTCIYIFFLREKNCSVINSCFHSWIPRTFLIEAKRKKRVMGVFLLIFFLPRIFPKIYAYPAFLKKLNIANLNHAHLWLWLVKVTRSTKWEEENVSFFLREENFSFFFFVKRGKCFLDYIF